MDFLPNSAEETAGEVDEEVAEASDFFTADNNPVFRLPASADASKEFKIQYKK